MQRKMNLQVSSLMILFSILTILVQFTIYYFFTPLYIIWGAAILVNLICCHLLLEQTTAFDSCFHYSILTIFISALMVMSSYFGHDISFLPYSVGMFGIAMINWLIPCIYCFVRNMLDYSVRYENYHAFYRYDSLLFSAVYLGLILYSAFGKNAFPFAYRESLDYANFLPFESITIQIEDYLYGILPLSEIVLYLLCRILLFIPYGFQMSLLLRRQSRLIRFLALILLPLLIELLQFFILPSRCDIDDMIYAVIGGLLGSILFYLCNAIYRLFTGKNFLSSEYDYPYSRNNLHF